ncbi:MAG TPA: sulfate adenylyltransferase subunit CysN [Actinomycetota bacterium]|nr:sulfate adenylyltransferase subunit CysN [Actinomycetota bacterium]
MGTPVDVHSAAAEQAHDIAVARKDILRIATAGSVDDGKSTLIGRLLYDSKAIFEDQYEAVERASKGDYVDLALLTDGLRAEREQGITIDVAYRYFATPRRKFIIADTPGHAQYTRNMITGASTADLAVVLIDARKGVLEQSRRHAFLSSLLGIPHMVVCINKMDLVGWSEQVFRDIRDDFTAFSMKLDIHDLTFIPISALLGDNVVHRSPHLAWYQGTSLLHHLEEVHIASDRNLIDARFPVQYVIRPQNQRDLDLHDYRGYAGAVASGLLRPGDEVLVLPSGVTTTIAGIDTFDGPVDEAVPPMAVTITLQDHIDISRGDMLCRPHNMPTISQDIDAMVCWMTDRSELRPGARYQLKHTTRTVRAVVQDVQYRLDINTLHGDAAAESLRLNDIGRVRLRTHAPLFFDEYRDNRETGSFILIDEATHNTVGAGMIRGAAGGGVPPH